MGPVADEAVDRNTAKLSHGYLSQLLGQMSVAEGTRPEEQEGQLGNDSVGMDLPPGESIDQGMEAGTDAEDGTGVPHAGAAETDEDEYEIYGDEDEEESQNAGADDAYGGGGFTSGEDM